MTENPGRLPADLRTPLATVRNENEQSIRVIKQTVLLAQRAAATIERLETALKDIAALNSLPLDLKMVVTGEGHEVTNLRELGRWDAAKLAEQALERPWLEPHIGDEVTVGFALTLRIARAAAEATPRGMYQALMGEGPHVLEVTVDEASGPLFKLGFELRKHPTYVFTGDLVISGRHVIDAAGTLAAEMADPRKVNLLSLWYSQGALAHALHQFDQAAERRRHAIAAGAAFREVL